MRVLLLVLALAGPAHVAGPTYGIRLDALVVNGSTAAGHCGPATVRISGIDPERSGTEVAFDLEGAGVIDITHGAKRLRAGRSIEDAFTVDRRTDVWCLATKQGPRLVIGVHCAAVHCLPVDYKAIDPVSMKVLGDTEECDRTCAERRVGARLPLGKN
jgi:hypothetical protein